MPIVPHQLLGSREPRGANLPHPHGGMHGQPGRVVDRPKPSRRRVQRSKNRAGRHHRHSGLSASGRRLAAKNVTGSRPQRSRGLLPARTCCAPACIAQGPCCWVLHLGARRLQRNARRVKHRCSHGATTTNNSRRSARMHFRARAAAGAEAATDRVALLRGRRRGHATTEWRRRRRRGHGPPPAQRQQTKPRGRPGPHYSIVEPDATREEAATRW